MLPSFRSLVLALQLSNHKPRICVTTVYPLQYGNFFGFLSFTYRLRYAPLYRQSGSDRLGDDHRYAIDASKLESELGWQAEETFISGLTKTVSWYLDNDWWWRPLREQVYTGERIGLILDNKES